MLIQVEAEMARRDLREFIRQAWHVVEPGVKYVSNWHIDAMCLHLMAVTRGEIRNLIINIPPRFMKSRTVAVFWPVWEWINNPSIQWLFVSYAQNLSVRDSVACRRLIMSPWFQERWGHLFQLSEDQNVKMRFENSGGGYRIATSVHGLITGEGGDRLVLDDPHNADEAQSKVTRESTIEWVDTSWWNRSNDPATVARVVVMQRLHEADATAHLLAKGNWEHLKLPAEYEPTNKVTSIGWSDPRTEDGELLWPGRFGREEVEDAKLSLGSYGYAGQYQQRPAPAGGGVFRRSWFRYYQGVAPSVRIDGRTLDMMKYLRFATIDIAASLKESADYTVMGVWGLETIRPWRMFLLDWVRERMEGPDIIPTAKSLHTRWQLDVIGIESVGVQLAIVQEGIRANLPVREIKVDRDKMARAIAATPRIEAGQVFFPAHASWLASLESEMLSFPQAEHDDQVDVVSSACLLADNLALSDGRPVRSDRDEDDNRWGRPKELVENARRAEGRPVRSNPFRRGMDGLMPR